VASENAALGEFELIARCFKGPAAGFAATALRHPKALGIGDDGAVLAPRPDGEQLVMAMDTMVESRHYFPDVDPAALGHKCLAVNLSDLAAMGAKPLGFTLSLAIRESRTSWLEEFSRGLLGLAQRWDCALLGGDTVRVPIGSAETISVAALGTVPTGRAIARSGAREGDDLWVSGALGDPVLALTEDHADPKLCWPEPRVALGVALRDLAHAAIDVSDGLVSELAHLMRASSAATARNLVARVRLEALIDCFGARLSRRLASGEAPRMLCRIAASGGDEYELLFAAPAEHRSALEALASRLALPLHCIGRVAQSADASAALSPVIWEDAQARPLPTSEWPKPGFEHF
jgi:thiamine-monophosphate kinase